MEGGRGEGQAVRGRGIKECYISCNPLHSLHSGQEPLLLDLCRLALKLLNTVGYPRVYK